MLFGAIWLGMYENIGKDYSLMKCSIQKKFEDFKKDDCQVFKNRFGVSDTIHLIEATEKYFYIKFWTEKYVIYRCNSNNNSTCLESTPLDVGKHMVAFIILPEKML